MIQDLIARAEEIRFETEDEANTTERVGSLLVDIVKAIGDIQLERRYNITMMGDIFSILCSEVTTLYKVVTHNISKLEYSTDNQATWKILAMTGTINAELPKGRVVFFRVEKSSIDVIAYVSFKGKEVI